LNAFEKARQSLPAYTVIEIWHLRLLRERPDMLKANDALLSARDDAQPQRPFDTDHVI
jgi:hypothetical protein